jgi:hypothetical protein
MKLDMRTQIRDYEGNVVKFKEDPNDDKEELKVLDYRRAFSISLNTPSVKEDGQPEQLSAEQKARVYALSSRIFSKPKPNFSLEDLQFIKERAGKVCTPLLYGRICEIIDPDSVEDEPEESEEDGQVIDAADRVEETVREATVHEATVHEALVD